MRRACGSGTPPDRMVGRSATALPLRRVCPDADARRSSTGSSQPPWARFTQRWPRRERRASGTTRNALRVCRRPSVEDDEHAQVLVGAEAMVGAGLDEHGVAVLDRHGRAFDLEDAVALEHDVDLVIGMRLLPVGLRRDEHVDAELEAGRLVNDLVAAAGGYEIVLDVRDAECMHRSDLTT